MTQTKKSNILLWATVFVYTIVTFTKINYSASIAYAVKEGIFNKTNSGIIAAAFYLIYGFGQIAGGKIVDKYSPYPIIGIGILGALSVNFALCFSNEYMWVLILWSFNGLIQSLVWPGCVKIVAECLMPEHQEKGTLLLTLSIAFGGICSYVLVSPVLEVFGWSGMFIMNTALLAIFLVVWMIVKAKTEKSLYIKKEKIEIKHEMPENLIHLIIRSGVIFALIAALIRALLDNGLKTWIPTMMMENYNISTIAAGMQTAAIYIFNMAGVFVIVPLIQKVKNELSKMVLLFAVSLPFAVVLIFVGIVPQFIAFMSLVLITTLTYALNNVQIMISSKFAAKGVGHSGAIAGLLNAFASFGVLLASGVFGYIAENCNWRAVSIFCVVLTFLACVISIPGIKLWKKFID